MKSIAHARENSMQFSCVQLKLRRRIVALHVSCALTSRVAIRQVFGLRPSFRSRLMMRSQRRRFIVLRRGDVGCDAGG